MISTAQEGTKEGARLNLGGERTGEDHEGFVEEAVTQLLLHLWKHMNRSMGF